MPTPSQQAYKIQLAQAQAQYNAALSQQAYNMPYNAATIGLTNGINSNTTGIGAYYAPGNQTAAGTYTSTNTYYPVTVPVPTHFITTINFIDANGITHFLTIDSAYAAIFAQISMQHQYGTAPTNSYTPPPSRMVDGEFSLDELSEAEKLIEEITLTQG